MQLKKRTIEELKEIVKRDYGILLSDEEANEFGSSLLRITRLAVTALARADEKKLVPSGKSESHF
jgi:hypothetical protein